MIAFASPFVLPAGSAPNRTQAISAATASQSLRLLFLLRLILVDQVCLLALLTLAFRHLGMRLLVGLRDGILGLHLILCHFMLPPEEHTERQRRCSVPSKLWNSSPQKAVCTMATFDHPRPVT
jgi:hypothetical protein